MSIQFDYAPGWFDSDGDLRVIQSLSPYPTLNPDDVSLDSGQFLVRRPLRDWEPAHFENLQYAVRKAGLPEPTRAHDTGAICFVDWDTPAVSLTDYYGGAQNDPLRYTVDSRWGEQDFESLDDAIEKVKEYRNA